MQIWYACMKNIAMMTKEQHKTCVVFKKYQTQKSNQFMEYKMGKWHSHYKIKTTSEWNKYQPCTNHQSLCFFRIVAFWRRQCLNKIFNVTFLQEWVLALCTVTITGHGHQYWQSLCIMTAKLQRQTVVPIWCYKESNRGLCSMSRLRRLTFLMAWTDGNCIFVTISLIISDGG